MKKSNKNRFKNIQKAIKHQNITLFFAVQLGAVSCGDAWKVLSARKWDDLSSYQRDLLNDGTYLQNCGSDTTVLQEVIYLMHVYIW